MKLTIILTLAIALFQEPLVSQDLEAAAFLVGEWEGDFTLYPSRVVQEKVVTPTRLSVEWGPTGAWIESEGTLEFPGGLPYAVKVVVFQGRPAGTLQAFVINSFGSSALYDGEATAQRLVFVGQVGSVTQRVIYEATGSDRLHLFIEESSDGSAFHPHSEAFLVRAGDG